MELSNLNIKNALCISIGANIESKFGTPIETLIKCRRDLENKIKSWIKENSEYPNNKNINSESIFTWSSLYETDPFRVEGQQPKYINTLLLINSNSLAEPTIEKAKSILTLLKDLEFYYGRIKEDETERWISRCLDLDILWWNNLQVNNKELTLPHPRFIERNFVITPLSEILSKNQNLRKLTDSNWTV